MTARPVGHARNAWIFRPKNIAPQHFSLMCRSWTQTAPDPNHNLQPKEAEMTRDELNRELRMHSATWQAVLVVYGVIVGALVLSAMAIVA